MTKRFSTIILERGKLRVPGARNLIQGLLHGVLRNVSYVFEMYRSNGPKPRLNERSNIENNDPEAWRDPSTDLQKYRNMQMRF